MRHALVLVLAAIQLAAAPATAAELVSDSGAPAHRTAAFAGARVRIALEGVEERDRLRAGLVVAPARRTEGSGMPGRLRFGEGVELGVSDARPLSLSIGGRPVTGRDAERLGGRRAGLSPLGWAAIGVGVVAVAVAIWYVDAGNRATD